jgi:nicotinamidase/pyrazinamidase
MKTLLVVDVQNDFCPGGALAVEKGDEVVPVLNDQMALMDLVVATADWHPSDHVSFAASHAGKEIGDEVTVNGLSQTLWPVHCVQNTQGAQFHPDLDRTKIDKTILKGTDLDIDSYSGFFDNGHQQKTELDDYLKGKGVTHVYVGGLATDYCVKYTVLDALDLGYKVTLLKPGCRGVDLNAGDIGRALKEMEAKGADFA